MSRLQQLLATAVITAFTFGAAQAVSAAPVVHAIAAPHAESASQATPVYYVWRHHHRVWVGRRHH